MEFLATILLGSGAMLVWMLAVSWLYDRVALWLWAKSYRLDAWVERIVGIPEDERRFS